MSTLASSILTTKGAVLVFTLPILFVSLPLAFSGAYLTLDKTRSFPSLGDPDDAVVLDVPGMFYEREGQEQGVFDWEKNIFKPQVPKANARFSKLMKSVKPKAKIWRLGGGVGGVLTGYLFGTCAPTILTLLVVERTSRTMTQVPFLIITFLCAATFSALCGLFLQATLFISCVGGSFAIMTFAAFAVDLSTVSHLVIWAIFAILFTVVPVISLFGTSSSTYTALHWSLRVSQSAFGSMGVVFSIAILAHVKGWEDGLDALWSMNKPDSGANLALSITGWMLFVLGIGSDWLLYRLLGPSQDQGWDDYLSHYLDNLPNRAGQFERLPSLWSRLTSIFRKSPKPLASSLGSLDGDSLPSSLGNIPKDRKRRSPRKPRPTVRFDLAAGFNDSDSGTEVELPSTPLKRPKLEYKPTTLDVLSESDTLLGSGAGDGPPDNEKKFDTWTIEKYEAEAEGDISSKVLHPEERSPDWKPAFLLKHQEREPPKANDN